MARDTVGNAFDTAILDPGDIGFRVHRSYEPKEGEPQRIPSEWVSFRRELKEQLIYFNLLEDDNDYILTTTEDIYSKDKQCFQIDKSGKLILPPDGRRIRIVDFNEKLSQQDYFVLTTTPGQTIAKGQLIDSKNVSNAINLRNSRWTIYDFIYYAPDNNWGLLLDGVYQQFYSEGLSKPYIFTTKEDLQLSAYQRVAIKEPGAMLLWLPKVVGEYATITDDLALLRSQSNLIVAPQGHLITGKNVREEDRSRVAVLDNMRGASKFEIKYFNENLWTLRIETDNG